MKNLELKDAVFLDADTMIGVVMEKMLTLGYAQYPVKEKNGKITGVVTKTELMNKLVKKRVLASDPVREVV